MKKYITPYNLLLLFVFMLNFFAYLAPVLMHFGLEEVAKYIYFIYSFFCHQLHYRSLHIFDYQVAWCTRDAFIWFGLFAAGVVFKFIKTAEIKWYEAILFVLPIGLDGGIQLVATMLGLSESGHVFYSSTNLTRMLTGSTLGVGLGMWIYPSLKEIETSYKDRRRKLSKTSVFGLLMTGLFVFYIFLIGLWNITATNYPPENILDSNVKLPENEEDWFVRRRDGYCPASLEDGVFRILNCDKNDGS
ncbi:DUF2085 domain-containing protein [Candidatus Dojkabacteria bacterium]|nr:DUF2085 domain-containing protein [Candidatus Dojkabacteria bacterium]